MYHECSHDHAFLFYISYFTIYFLYIFIILCHIYLYSSSYCTTLLNTLLELRVLYFIFVSHHSKGLPAVLLIITFGGVIHLSFFKPCVRSSSEEAVRVLWWRCSLYVCLSFLQCVCVFLCVCLCEHYEILLVTT